MNFVYPNFLWALFALLIPIIIHLFSFRKYKTIYFSRVEFLKEVKEDSRTGARLKHLLILISRLLFLACLILAFAQPFIPSGEGETTENVTSIYIDNSLSMQAEGKDGNLLNEAKNTAIDLIESIDENEKINILTTDLNAEDQRYISKNEALERIKEIDFSSQSTDLQTVINISSDLFERQEMPGNKRIIIFSDFQKSVSDLLPPDSIAKSIFLYKTEQLSPGNIFIDSVWFDAPVHKIEQPTTLFFRVQNQTNENIENISVTLQINDDSPRPKQISIAPNAYTVEKITYNDRSAGDKKGTLSIATNQLFFDDEFFFTYCIQDKIPILILSNPNEKSTNLSQLYQLSDYYDAAEIPINVVNTTDFEGKSLIICQNIETIPSGIKELIKSSLQNGATAVFIPGSKANIRDWNMFFNEFKLPNLLPYESTNSELTYFNDSDPIYAGNFDEKPTGYKFPQLANFYRFQVNSNQNFIPLFGLTTSSPFLVYTPYKNGRVFLQGAPILSSASNFQNHALFGLTYLRIAETSTFQSPLYMNLGNLTNFPVNEAFQENNALHVINTAFSVDAIPQMITANNGRFVSLSPIAKHIKQAGFYALTNQNDYNKILALNFDRKESYIASYESDELRKRMLDMGFSKVELLTNNASGKIELNQLKANEYWRILLILALIFLAIEVALIKLWSA